MGIAVLPAPDEVLKSVIAIPDAFSDGKRFHFDHLDGEFCLIEGVSSRLIRILVAIVKLHAKLLSDRVYTVFRRLDLWNFKLLIDPISFPPLLRQRWCHGPRAQ